MAAPKKIRLGDLLIEHGIISSAQLQEALGDKLRGPHDARRMNGLVGREGHKALNAVSVSQFRK